METPCDVESLEPGPARPLPEFKAGDRVQVECYSGHGDPFVGTIKQIKVKYDEDTGDPYKVIVLNDGHQFDAVSGTAITEPTMYYIEGPA